MFVLVTGVSRYVGAQLAARLAVHPRVDEVVGFDTVPPRGRLRELLDERGIATTVGEARDVVAAVTGGVDVVAHMGVVSAPGSAGRTAMKEQNIIGTMQLLAACQATPRVRKLVIRSSTAAYGASFRDPAVFSETMPPTLHPRGGFAKDVIEIEGYVRGFGRRRPDVVTTVLRLAPFVGADADTTLTRYFTLPVVPTVLGRDPRLQFIHIDDALELLLRAVVENHRGTYNVAGDGVMTLSQALRRAGRVAVPVVEPGMSVIRSLATTGLSLARSTRLGLLTAMIKASGMAELSHDQLDLFVHGRVVDTRALVEEFGFRPRTTSEAFADFVKGRDLHRSVFAPLRPDTVGALETVVLDGIRRVRSSREGAPDRDGQP